MLHIETKYFISCVAIFGLCSYINEISSTGFNYGDEVSITLKDGYVLNYGVMVGGEHWLSENVRNIEFIAGHGEDENHNKFSATDIQACMINVFDPNNMDNIVYGYIYVKRIIITSILYKVYDGQQIDLTYVNKLPNTYISVSYEKLVNGNRMDVEGTPTDAGSYFVRLSAKDSLTNESVYQIEGSFVILRAEATTDLYTVPTGLTAAYGDTLADVELPAGFSWQDTTQLVGPIGTNTFLATFISDNGNYAKADIEIEV